MAEIRGYTEEDVDLLAAEFTRIVQDAIVRVCEGVANNLTVATVAAAPPKFHLPGKHNQKDHARGGKIHVHTLPDGWSQVSLDEAAATYAKNHPHVARYAPEEIDARLAGSTVYAFGEHRLYVDNAGHYTQDQMDDAFSTVEDLTGTFTSRGGPAMFHVGDVYLEGAHPSVMGLSRVSQHNDIRIRGSVLDGTHPSLANPDVMPAGRDPNVSGFRYTATHEYGHGMQPRLGDAKLEATHAAFKASLNPYGQKTPQEGFAEAFTEWTLSDGLTSNDAAIGYANAYGW